MTNYLLMKKFSVCITALLMMFFTVSVHAQTKKPVTKKAPVKKTAAKKPVVKKVANAPKLIRVPGTRVKITTDSGVIVIRLYDKTPKHRDNFIKLANEHFFDSLLFHRVMNEFMIQGGDPLSKNAPPGTMLGSGDVGYTIPAEFDTSLFHKKGALAGARQPDHVNPKKASSGCQFYIVHGKTLTDADLNMIEMQTGIKIPAAKRKIYKTIGGYPFLDMNYTVFGEVESGFEVIDKIASVNRDGMNRPLGDIRMFIEVIK